MLSERQPYPLRELAETLQYELGLQAVPSSLHLGSFPAARQDRVYILLDPIGYRRLEGELALPGDSILRRTIFVCTEQPSSGDDDELSLLGLAGSVFVLDQSMVVAMHRLGIPARLLRPGYSRSLDHFDPEAARPIDVMFLGSHSVRRTKYLSRASRVLSRHNCLLQISEGIPSDGDTTSFRGKSRWPLLAQTKVVINLHRDDGSRFEWRRALDAIHCGAVVVTEHSSGMSPLVAGEHLIVSSPDSLQFVLEGVLRDEERLARLRQQAYERLCGWMPFALWVSVLRAAIVELVGEPVPHLVSLGLLRRQPADMEVASDPTADCREPAVAGMRAVVSEVAGTEVAHETPAWAAHRAVPLTVLMGLSGGAEKVTETLDSLSRSRWREFELIIIDTGSSDVTVQTVDHWMSDHPRVAARLVVSPRVRGRGAARNVGLDFARGSFCAVMDPGQELYPRCLEVLVGTLQAMPDVAFVYPIQEVSGSAKTFVDGGGDYLLSFLGWEPRRFRLGNHIFGPALIRTDRLREIGGYAVDARLDGFEDYDLWCRMANRGWRGQVVPQELARRHESGSSCVLSQIRLAGGAAATALSERAPRLFAGAAQ